MQGETLGSPRQTLGAHGIFQEGAGFSAQPWFSHWKLGAPPALHGMPE